MWKIWNSMNTARHDKPRLKTLKHPTPRKSIISPIHSHFFPYYCSICCPCFHIVTSSSHSKCHSRIQLFFKLWVSFRKLVSIWCSTELQQLWKILVLSKFHHMWWVWEIFWQKKISPKELFLCVCTGCLKRTLILHMFNWYNLLPKLLVK